MVGSDSPTETSIPASLKISKVGLVTKPEPLDAVSVRIVFLMVELALAASEHVEKPWLFDRGGRCVVNVCRVASGRDFL